MPLSSIVIVFLRLVGLNWIISGIFHGAVVIRTFAGWSDTGVFSAMLPALAYFGTGALLLMWSRTIARAVTPHPDPEVQLGGLTLYDLYCFGFTIVGLYYVLSSVAPVINWLHYALIQTRDDSNREQNFYELTQPLLTMLAGGACMLFSARFARKLIVWQRREAKHLPSHSDTPSAKPSESS
jgi:hypothetical protein